MFIASFVHGFEDPTFPVPPGRRAALASIGPDGIGDVAELPFPRVPSDFGHLGIEVRGDVPLGQEDFRPLPRFGVTGLDVDGDRLYAGRWNGV